uniref:Gag-like protein n=1 Tax=Trichogramma kaykai TaxID=54128 RepID=A0ABD2WBG9_9HYME
MSKRKSKISPSVLRDCTNKVQKKDAQLLGMENQIQVNNTQLSRDNKINNTHGGISSMSQETQPGGSHISPSLPEKHDEDGNVVPNQVNSGSAGNVNQLTYQGDNTPHRGATNNAKLTLTESQFFNANNTQHSLSSKSSSMSDLNTSKTVKLPPIKLQVGANEVIRQVESKGLKFELKVKNTGNSQCIILTDSLDQFNNTTKLLKDVGIEFFTYTPKCCKPKSIVLKGLHSEVSEEEIKACILSWDLQNVKLTSLKKMSKNLWLIQVTADSNIRELTRNKCVLHQVVSWENLRKNSVPQCRNCQRFEHIASNCNLEFRCVKCTQKHERGKCLVGTSPEHKVQCVLCGKEGHPASYKGCEMHIKAQEKYKSQRTATLLSKTKSHMSKLNTSNPQAQLSLNDRPTFAQVLSQASQQRHIKSTNTSWQHSAPNSMETNSSLMQDIQSNVTKLVSRMESFSNDMASMKSELRSGFISELSAVNNKVDNNTRKIDVILDTLKIQWKS